MNKFTTKMATLPPNFELSTINPTLSYIGDFSALAFCKSAGALLCFGQEVVL